MHISLRPVQVISLTAHLSITEKEIKKNRKNVNEKFNEKEMVIDRKIASVTFNDKFNENKILVYRNLTSLTCMIFKNVM